MTIKTGWVVLAIPLLIMLDGASAETPSGAILEAPSAADIVSHCDNKYPGRDQRGMLLIVLRDAQGHKHTMGYQRLWRDNRGENGIADKMVLRTIYPPDARGASFMRWTYTTASSKNADQWVYIPALRKLRRVAVRDLNDSFLGSDLTYGDITPRSVNDDEHTLVNIETNADGKQVYVVSSVPHEATSLYGRKVAHFLKSDDWDTCLKTAVDYYDRQGNMLKRQTIAWQRIGVAWLWETVEVKNVQTGHASVFQVRDAAVDTGLRDEQFSERALKVQ